MWPLCSASTTCPTATEPLWMTTVAPIRTSSETEKLIDSPVWADFELRSSCSERRTGVPSGIFNMPADGSWAREQIGKAKMVNRIAVDITDLSRVMGVSFWCFDLYEPRPCALAEMRGAPLFRSTRVSMPARHLSQHGGKVAL